MVKITFRVKVNKKWFKTEDQAKRDIIIVLDDFCTVFIFIFCCYIELLIFMKYYFYINLEKINISFKMSLPFNVPVTRPAQR